MFEKYAQFVMLNILCAIMFIHSLVVGNIIQIIMHVTGFK